MNRKIARNIRIVYNSNMDSFNLIKSAEDGDLSGVKAALAAGEDINTREEGTGITALHAASARRRIEVVRFLLSCEGIDATAIDRFGETAFSLAEQVGDTEIMSEIQKHLDGKVLGSGPLAGPTPE